MPERIELQFGLTAQFPCGYLSDAIEQLLVLREETLLTPQGYERLLTANFRRSGNDIYRPHCPFCSACESLRIDAFAFTPSRGQKRILARNRDLTVKTTEIFREEHYALYERYIELRHADGVMYPPSLEQYQHFLDCSWLKPLYLELYLGEKLLAIAITDRLPNSLSAMYTFFDPDFEERSLGTMAILTQIELAKQSCRRWLYLGYQVEECPKMSYKRHYHPHERFRNGVWLVDLV